MRVLEAKDKTGRMVYLTDERWSHINAEHPEVAAYLLVELPELLKHPTAVVARDEKVHYFYKYLKPMRRYLLVLVNYLNGEGFIITAYLTRSIP